MKPAKDVIYRFDAKGNSKALIPCKVIYIAVLTEPRDTDKSNEMHRAIVKERLDKRLAGERLVHSFLISVE